jgi:peptidyl-prolyl cis-trans isomerase SurA
MKNSCGDRKLHIRNPLSLPGRRLFTLILTSACMVMVMLSHAPEVSADSVDRIVAVVNNDIILYSELQEQTKLMRDINPNIALDNPQQQTQFQREVLQRMIADRLAEQEVTRLKINVTDLDLDKAVANFKKENGFTDDQLKYVLQQEGKSIEEFRKGIKKQIERGRLIERVLKSKTVVTDKQIDDYLKNGSIPDDSEERRHLAVIFLPVQGAGQVEEVEGRAKEIHKRLQQGEDFSQMAREYSRGPAVEEGGDIGYIAAKDLAPAIESATRGLAANDMTPPMKTPQGFYIIKVIDVQRDRQIVSSTDSRDRARNVLFQQEIDRKYEQWIKELTDKSFIQVNL